MAGTVLKMGDGRHEVLEGNVGQGAIARQGFIDDLEDVFDFMQFLIGSEQLL